MRNALKKSSNDEEVNTVLNRVYQDGFEDGSNDREEE